MAQRSLHTLQSHLPKLFDALVLGAINKAQGAVCRRQCRGCQALVGAHKDDTRGATASACGGQGPGGEGLQGDLQRHAKAGVGFTAHVVLAGGVLADGVLQVAVAHSHAVDGLGAGLQVIKGVVQDPGAGQCHYGTGCRFQGHPGHAVGARRVVPVASYIALVADVAPCVVHHLGGGGG